MPTDTLLPTLTDPLAFTSVVFEIAFPSLSKDTFPSRTVAFPPTWKLIVRQKY